MTRSSPTYPCGSAQPGDRYLLCTDGLSGVLSAATIADTLGVDDPGAAADRLVALALRGGGPDNVTVVVVDVLDGEPDEGDPVVAGAVAADVPRAAIEDSPAARARAAQDRQAAQAEAATAAQSDDDAEEVEEDTASRHRTVPRVAIVGAVAVLLLAAGVGGAYAWINGQWYVGSARHADSEDVAIFHGVPGSVAGVKLAREHERVQLPVAALPDYEQQPVRDGINADNLAAARRIVERLVHEACPSPAPTPTPSGFAPTRPAATTSPPPVCGVLP